MLRWSFAFALVFGAVGLPAACSTTPSPPASTSGSVACSFTGSGLPECYEYTDLDTDEVNNAKINCSQQPGVSFVASCPTIALVGCCHETMAGVNFADCYYGAMGDAGGATTLEMTCTHGGGVWSVLLDAGS
jgi:hypothetical protein